MTLPPDLALLVRLSAALATGDDEEVEAGLREAASVCEAEEVHEAIVQTCLFLGFPVALEAAARWREIVGQTCPDRDPLAPPARAHERGDRGAALCEAVYGSAYGALRDAVGAASPALDRLMVEVGYGTVLARPGLSPKRRELCLVAILAAEDRGPQLHSHLRGALRLGAPAEWVDEALDVGLDHAPPAARDGLRQIWAGVRCREGGTSGVH